MTIWKTYHAREPLPDYQLNQTESLVISLSHTGPVVQSIPAAYHTILEILAENKTFGTSCEHLSRLEQKQDVFQTAARYLTVAILNRWISSTQVEGASLQKGESSG